MASCATNASTNRCSHRWLKQGASLNVGASITTQRAHIRASITKHRKSSLRTGTLRSITRRCQMQRLRRQRARPLRYVGPPRPGPLLNRPARGKMRTDSTYDWREIGEQVNRVLLVTAARQHVIRTEHIEHLQGGRGDREERDSDVQHCASSRSSSSLQAARNERIWALPRNPITGMAGCAPPSRNRTGSPLPVSCGCDLARLWIARV